MVSLRQIRKRHLLSIRELARKAGVSPVTLMHVEQGKRTPALRTARRLSAALEIDPSEVDEFRPLLEDDEGKAAA
jgi:transcriptional regulator with XRE-family HTH domain